MIKLYQLRIVHRHEGENLGRIEEKPMRSVESITTPPVVPCVPIDSLQFLELFDDVNVDGGIGVPRRFFRVKKQQRSFRYWLLAAYGQKGPKCLAPLQSMRELVFV